jgi:hypothetical protein
MSFFSKFRRFPEFHAVIASLAALSKAETSIIEGHTRAFGEEFRRYATSQKGSFVESLNALCKAGTEQVKIEKDTWSGLQNLPQDLQPLLKQEEEIAQWRQLYVNLNEVAVKSRAAADKAEIAFQKSSGAGRANAETALSRAKRKAEADESSAQDQKTALEKKEVPFQETFLESFVKPFVAAVELRYKAAENLLALAGEYETAAEGIEVFEDPTIERFEKRLEDLRQVVVE